MKKILLISFLFLAVFSMAQAQRDTSGRPSRSEGGERQRMMDPAERIERDTKELREKLSLTDEQTAQVKSIYTKYSEKQREVFEKMREARESGNDADRDKIREQMQKNRESQNKEIKALLKDDQKEKFDAFVKEREARMRNRPGPGGAPQN